jgi:hypothetical protein
MPDGSTFPAARLAPGARFRLTDKAGRLLRPLSTKTGEVVADKGDCWEVRFDGVRATRRIWKWYLRREIA